MPSKYGAITRPQPFNIAERVLITVRRHMERNEYIRTYVENRTFGDNSILYALIRCLNVREALDLLRRSYKEDQALRDATLYVLDDLEGEGREQALVELAREIMEEFPALPARRRSSAFLCLGELLQRISDDDAHEVKLFLLRSKYAAGRRKGLKSLGDNEVLRYRSEIEHCAEKYNEHRAIMLIIDHFSPEYVYERRQKLRDALDAPWAVARLYLRASDYNASCLNELQHYDGITFAYAKAKRGERVTLDEARALIEEYRLDDRIGLLAWSFGKMGLWDVLVLMAEHAEDWTKERFGLLGSG